MSTALAGKVETDDLFDPRDTRAAATTARAERETAEIKKRMSPPGALGLPALLEARRLEFGLPDGIFSHRASFDRILVAQVPRLRAETYGDTKIIMTDVAKDRNEQSAPRGVIVSAGLCALDRLRSNGMDIGHLITFTKFAPWRIPVDMILGKEHYLMVLYSGDIVSCEDTHEMLKKGELKETYSVTKGRIEHMFVGPDGVALVPYETANAQEGY